MGLIEKVFTDKQPEEIAKLLQDDDCKKLLLKNVSSELQDYGDIIWAYPKDQILAIAMQPDFAELDEGFYVGNVIINYMTESKDLLPMISQHRGLELAERGLICLSFFYEHMEMRCERYGAPSPEFYVEMVKKTYIMEGMRNLAENFSNWQEYLHSQFNSISINEML